MAKTDWGEWNHLENIGGGGQGRVFKVEHKVDGRIGALKRLMNVNRLDRFQTEIEAAQRLDHPNIAKLYDFHIDGKNSFAVFEYVEGGSIGDLSKDDLFSIVLSASWPINFGGFLAGHRGCVSDHSVRATCPVA